MPDNVIYDILARFPEGKLIAAISHAWMMTLILHLRGWLFWINIIFILFISFTNLLDDIEGVPKSLALAACYLWCIFIARETKGAKPRGLSRSDR